MLLRSARATRWSPSLSAPSRNSCRHSGSRATASTGSSRNCRGRRTTDPGPSQFDELPGLGVGAAAAISRVPRIRARRTARSLLAIARIAVSTTCASSEASPEVISPPAIAAAIAAVNGGTCWPFERRQVEPQAAVAAPRMEAFKAQVPRRRIAFECHLDRLSGQRLGLAFEQQFGGQRPLVPRAADLPHRVAGLPFWKGSAARLRPTGRRRCFCCILQGICSHPITSATPAAIPPSQEGATISC